MIALLTGWRCGGTFLSYQLENCTNEDIKFVHPNVYVGEYQYPDHKTLTILRNPLDSLASSISMQYHKDWNNYVYDYVKNDITYYIECYKYFRNNIDLFIDYNDLLNYPQETFDMICNEFNIVKTRESLLSQEEYELWHTSTLAEWKLVSSARLSETYSKIRQLLIDEIDLSECDSMYQELMLNVKHPQNIQA